MLVYTSIGSEYIHIVNVTNSLQYIYTLIPACLFNSREKTGQWHCYIISLKAKGLLLNVCDSSNKDGDNASHFCYIYFNNCVLAF